MSEELLTQLQHQHPEDVKRWLLDIQAQRNSVTTDANWWLTLAQGAAHHAYLKPHVSSEDQLTWAEVAIRIYDYMDTHLNSSPHIRHLSAMALRSVMIDRQGPKAHHFVLDPQRIEQWFFDHVPMTLEDAHAIAQNPSQTSREKKMELHNILDRLIPFDALLENGLVQRAHDMRQWQDIQTMIRTAKTR